MDLIEPSATPEAMLPGSRSARSPVSPVLKLKSTQTIKKPLSFSIDAIMSTECKKRSLHEEEEFRPRCESRSSTGDVDVSSDEKETSYQRYDSREEDIDPVSTDEDVHNQSFSSTDHSPSVSPNHHLSYRVPEYLSKSGLNRDNDAASTDEKSHNNSYGSMDRSPSVSPSHQSPLHHPYGVPESLTKSPVAMLPGGIPRPGPSVNGQINVHPFLVSPDTGARWPPNPTPQELAWFSRVTAMNGPPKIGGKISVLINPLVKSYTLLCVIEDFNS